MLKYNIEVSLGQKKYSRGQVSPRGKPSQLVLMLKLKKLPNGFLLCLFGLAIETAILGLEKKYKINSQYTQDVQTMAQRLAKPVF